MALSVAVNPAVQVPPQATAGLRRHRVDWRWLLPRLLLALPLFHAWVTLAAAWSDPTFRDTDLYPLYVHAERVRAGAPLYWPWPEYGPHYMTGGLRYPAERHPYPPFLSPALSFLSQTGLAIFARVWTVLLLAAFWAYAASLAKLATRRWALMPTMAAGLMLFAVPFPAAQSALLLGNVDPLLWAAFGVALAARRLRGMGFAVLALVKLYGAWPLVLAARVREWAVLRTAALTAACAVALSVLALGAAGFVAALRAWSVTMLPVVGQGTFSPYNLSISFAGLRAARAAGWAYAAGPLPAGARIYLAAVGIGAPLVTAWLTRHKSHEMRYAAITCAAVFFAPLAWNFYVPLLLAPAAIALGERRGFMREAGGANAAVPERARGRLSAAAAERGSP